MYSLFMKEAIILEINGTKINIVMVIVEDISSHFMKADILLVINGIRRNTVKMILEDKLINNKTASWKLIMFVHEPSISENILAFRTFKAP